MQSTACRVVDDLRSILCTYFSWFAWRIMYARLEDNLVRIRDRSSRFEASSKLNLLQKRSPLIRTRIVAAPPEKQGSHLSKATEAFSQCVTGQDCKMVRVRWHLRWKRMELRNRTVHARGITSDFKVTERYKEYHQNAAQWKPMQNKYSNSNHPNSMFRNKWRTYLPKPYPFRGKAVDWSCQVEMGFDCIVDHPIGAYWEMDSVTSVDLPSSDPTTVHRISAASSGTARNYPGPAWCSSGSTMCFPAETSFGRRMIEVDARATRHRSLLGSVRVVGRID